MGDISPNFSEWYRPPPSCMRMSSSFFFVFFKKPFLLELEGEREQSKMFSSCACFCHLLVLGKDGLVLYWRDGLETKNVHSSRGAFLWVLSTKKERCVFCVFADYLTREKAVVALTEGRGFQPLFIYGNPRLEPLGYPVTHVSSCSLY